MSEFTIYKAIPLQVYNTLMNTKRESKPLEISEIVKKLKSRQSSRAQEILSLLKSSQNFSWNSVGEIIYKDKVELNTNIRSLISFATKSSAGQKPRGFKIFLIALKQEQVPLSLLPAHFKKLLKKV